MTSPSSLADVQRRLIELERKVSPLLYANQGGPYYPSNNFRGTQNTHSQLIGGFHPVLGDFALISTYELQSPFKSQLGLSIVPTGKLADGCNVFGLINEVDTGVYTCGLISQGFDGAVAPSMLLSVISGNAATLIAMWNNGGTKYGLMFGSGTQSNASGTYPVAQFNGDTQKLWSIQRTPTNSADTGYLGETCFDDNFLYIYCTTGWKRTALAAF